MSILKNIQYKILNELDNICKNYWKIYEYVQRSYKNIWMHELLIYFIYILPYIDIYFFVPYCELIFLLYLFSFIF